MKTHKILLIVIVLGTMIAATGCGGGSESSSTAANVQTKSVASDAGQAQGCSLVTKAEMEAALGQPVIEPTPVSAAGKGTDCSYKTVAQNGVGLPQLTVHLLYYPGVNPGQDPTRQQTVSGIGDDAYYSDSGLSVIKGGNWLVITYFKPGVANPGPDLKMEDLARKAAARMS